MNSAEDSKPMQPLEALRELKFLSSDIWTRDKTLFADKLKAALPSIIQVIVTQAQEIVELRNERDRLQGKLLRAESDIQRRDADQLEARRVSITYRDWTEALDRIKGALESLKSA